MFIAVLSDSHDNMQNIQRAIALATERAITHAFHLGDFCAPPALEILAQSSLHFYCVWGNVDGDRLAGFKKVAPYGTFDIVSTDFREIELGNRQIFLTHYPEIARIAALSGQFDAIFYGHDHLAAQEIIEVNGKKVLLANPGELAGFRYGEPSFGVYNTEDNSFEHVKI